MVEVGAILEGKVTGLTNFGAFVTLPDNVTGMVHISEVSTSFVSDIHDFLQEGQTVKVKVLDVTPQGKVSLSIKKTMEQPAGAASERPRRSNDRQNRRNGTPNVWKGSETKHNSEPQSFEDMMARFKQVSDEKISDLKRANEGGRRSSYSRRK